jgi:flagella basal body P-ring formation protein FlgA
MISLLLAAITATSTLAGAASSELPVVSLKFLDSATVSDTVIRLGDIARLQTALSPEQMDKLNKTVIGEAAPAGFSRRVNSDDVIGYVLKSKFAGFSFKRQPQKIMRVSTVCQEIKIDRYENLIEKYVRDSVKWRAGDYTVQLRNKEEKWKCLPGPVTVQMAGLAEKYPRGNVNLRLIARQGSKTYLIPAVCYVTVVTPVVVAKTNISRGTPLTTENCIIERKDITRFGYEPLTSLEAIQDLLSLRTISKETIIHEKMITRAPVVIKDERVYLVVDRKQIRVSVAMRAREPGAVGDRIWVENEMSHKLIKTKVVGKGKVQLLEGEKAI